MDVILSFMAIGAFCTVAAIIEVMLEGHSPSDNNLSNIRQNNRRRRLKKQEYEG